MSEVIYRKFRPERFSEFIGQEHIVKTITNAIENETTSHAYLFAGPRGTGKTTLARLLSKAVNCENRNGFEPCGECSACREIAEGRSMDLIEIDAASHRGIDDIRKLREGIKFNPSSLKYKVFIIDEAHQLTKAASNALLKTLEEPPSHALFILATTEPQKLIATILSRCQRFNFRLLKISEIVGKMSRILKAEGIEVDEAALYAIARAARGSIRDAESLLDQVVTFAGGDKEIEIEEVNDVLGLIEIDMIADFVDLVFNRKQKEALKLFNSYQKEGLNIQEFADNIVNYLRQALILKMGGGEEMVLSVLSEEEAENLKDNINEVDGDRVSAVLKEFLRASNQLKYSSIPQLPVELALLDSCED